MELSRGVNIPVLNLRKHCLMVAQNIYGGKEREQTWYKHPRNDLEEIDFSKLRNNNCLLVKGTTLFMLSHTMT